MRSRARFLTGFDVFYLELDLTTLVRVLLDGVADVESATLPEGDAVHDVVRLVVHQLQFNVLLIASYDFARAIVIHMTGTENGFFVFRTEGVELLQITEELRGDVLKVNLRVNVDNRTRLFGQNVLRHELFETPGESGHVFHLHGKAGGIRMSTEILQQITAILNGLVDIEARYGARRTGSQIIGAGQYHRRTIIDFRQA